RALKAKPVLGLAAPAAVGISNTMRNALTQAPASKRTRDEIWGMVAPCDGEPARCGFVHRQYAAPPRSIHCFCRHGRARTTVRLFLDGAGSGELWRFETGGGDVRHD